MLQRLTMQSVEILPGFSGSSGQARVLVCLSYI